MADKWNFNDFSWVKINIMDIENVIMKKILPDKSLDFAQTLGSNLELGELYISEPQSDIYNSDSSVIAYRNLGTSYQKGTINKSKLTYIDTSIHPTIQLQDGKWNYSKFEWYNSGSMKIKLYKILQNKVLDNYSIPYSEMVDGELYIEDNLSETNRYNADEWAMAYVFLKGKKYYAYIKKSIIELNLLAPSPEQPQQPPISPEIPQQPPISPEIPPIISGTTIKEQTEKTERLKTSLDDKVIAIADEIKKQDNIDITRLSEVPGAIAQLKKSRKRWATGSGVKFGSEGNSVYDQYISIDLSKCSFDPQNIILILTVSGGKTPKEFVIGLFSNGVRTIYSKDTYSNDITSGLLTRGYNSSLLEKLKDSKSNYVSVIDYGSNYLIKSEVKGTWFAFE